MTKEISTHYDQSKESEIYKLWESSGYFNPDNLEGEPFTIIMPPSNANGQVHVGHALGFTLQDTIIRYQRMLGKKTLWLPGTDHAGFETQVVFEKKLEKEGRSRFQMTREEFYKEIWDFVQENKKQTEDGIKRLGASADWSRNMFTLDPRIIKIVYETFEQMYNDGLIYRDNRICNWCPKHQTGLSDLETKYEERTEPFYYFKYGPFTIATSRPETKFGDKYVVMHPDDKRYQDYTNGQKIELEWINGPITATVIKDKAVDPEFGSGVMTITPAHDATDFEIAQRHKLDFEQIIDKRGKLLPIAGEFVGVKILEARPKIIEKLKAKGLLEKVDENYKHNVQLCYKCSNLIEPQVIPQWYVAMTKEIKGKALRDKIKDAIESGEVVINPESKANFLKTWLNEIRDWPISRQTWWGIPIPAWYKGDKVKISEDSPGEGWEKDPDTFDTWFSSGQWPYATLMALGEKDFETFYPTRVLETGWDIIFFWVARMIMFGQYKTGKPPFSYVYLHGLVRDKDRQKMSKSKGNVIDPLGVIDTYGNDALRMALLVGNLPGNDLPLSEQKVKGYRNFANKIWNAARFVMQNTEGYDPSAKLHSDDENILNDLNQIIITATNQMNKYALAHAAEDLYHYFWHTFADKIIEESKAKLANPETKASTQRMLREILETNLKLLHPFMPFVTETIWQMNHKDLLMVESWPSNK
ncbi:MAG: valine--tRNA ligase [Candidatus Doudnabacteria bacterium RIFCSPLOWO2_02_FULL_42_9]|nr:MAG: valine--tRNA ligase [Candidatus Doudnabacteria bacterium RIFCSPLOWO2_02_FULL_42_9]